MSAAADQAMRAWLNLPATGLSDGQGGGPLPNGTFLMTQASPETGAYAVVSSTPAARSAIAAEDSRVSQCRTNLIVRAGTQQAAENACVAVANAIRTLTGCPAAAGDDAGTLLLVHDNLTEPAFVPMPGAGGEQYAYVTSADIVMYVPE